MSMINYFDLEVLYNLVQLGQHRLRNKLLPDRHQDIIQTITDLFRIGPYGIHLDETSKHKL